MVLDNIAPSSRLVGLVTSPQVLNPSASAQLLGKRLSDFSGGASEGEGGGGSGGGDGGLMTWTGGDGVGGIGPGGGKVSGGDHGVQVIRGGDWTPINIGNDGQQLPTGERSCLGTLDLL